MKLDKNLNINPMLSTVNELVDAVYVLSVKSFTARIEHIKHELSKHGIAFKFIFEHDADELDPKIVETFFTTSNLRKEHQSLVMKNIAAWRLAAANNHKRVLIFEDDAILTTDFLAQFNLAMAAAGDIPEGWLIFLGGADVKVPDYYFLAEGPLVKLPISTAEAYITDLTAIRSRLKWIDTNKITLPADHLIRHMDQQCEIDHYWLIRAIVKQGSTTGLFDSVLDSHRLKHSRLFTVLRNRWNILRRQQLRRFTVKLKAKFKL